MLGVHWPLDVLWGMVGGWLGAWTGLALQARWRWPTAGRGGLLAGAVLMAVTASLLVSRHIGIPAVMPAQRVVAAVCLAWGAWEIGCLGRLYFAREAPYAAQAPLWRATMAWMVVRLVQRAQRRRNDG
jgi:hypothetical protein